MRWPYVLTASMAIFLLVACSGQRHPTAARTPQPSDGTTSAVTATASVSESDSPTPDVSQPPTPEQLGFVDIPTTDEADNPSDLYIKARPLPVAVPFHDGPELETLVGFSVTVQPGETGSESSVVNDQFELAPTHGAGALGNSSTYSSDAGDYPEAQNAIRRVCGRVPLFDTAAKRAGLDVASGVYTFTGDFTAFTGCLTFDYVKTEHPNRLLYSSSSPSMTSPGQPTATGLWTGKLPVPGAATLATTLAHYSGSGPQLITIPAAVQGVGRKLCWNMPGGGNHIIEGEDSTNGSGITLYTNTTGSSDAQCRSYVQVQAYLQVLAEGSWDIIIKNF